MFGVTSPFGNNSLGHSESVTFLFNDIVHVDQYLCIEDNEYQRYKTKTFHLANFTNLFAGSKASEGPKIRSSSKSGWSMQAGNLGRRLR